jgi:acetyl-CoA acetyltransferase
MSREAVIIDSVRTGLAKAHRGSFNITRPDDQLAHCIAQLFTRNPSVDRAEVGDVIAGCGIPEGPQGMNVARIATVVAGLPTSVAATTVNRFCSSGSQAIMMAANQIIQEGVDIAIGSGVETITMLQDGAQIVTASAWHPESAAAEGSTIRLWLSRMVSGLYKLLIGQDVAFHRWALAIWNSAPGRRETRRISSRFTFSAAPRKRM